MAPWQGSRVHLAVSLPDPGPGGFDRPSPTASGHLCPPVPGPALHLQLADLRAVAGPTRTAPAGDLRHGSALFRVQITILRAESSLRDQLQESLNQQSPRPARLGRRGAGAVQAAELLAGCPSAHGEDNQGLGRRMSLVEPSCTGPCHPNMPVCFPVCVHRRQLMTQQLPGERRLNGIHVC